MTITYEPEFNKAFAPFAAAIAAEPKPRPGNLEDTKTSIHGFYSAMVSQLPELPSVSHEIHYTTSKDGHQIPVWFFYNKEKRKETKMTSAVFYVHGGGYVTGSVEFLRKQIEARVEATGIPFFAPGYRLAPENPHPVPHEDCFAALKWVHENAADKARDEKLSPPLAKMDDRNSIPNPEVEHLFTWSHDNNETAWKALIGDRDGEIDCYGAAARATKLRGLPRTYLDVGSLDIFVHDTVDYAQRLMRENVEVELHVWPRVPHGFEGLAPQTRYGKMAIESRVAAVRSL
ncbi:hypothetical protein KCU65_g4854, partial [Aureobasidium melanogenum]